jgi:biotin carboxylase
VVHLGDPSRRLLVLGAGPPQLGLLRAARFHGVWTAVCDRDAGAPGFRFADRRCIVSVEDEPAIERIAAAFPLAGVIAPGRDRSAAVAARVAERLGLSHPLSSATAALTSNRPRQHEALAAAGVPQPHWQLLTADGALELPLPVVVKVVNRGGQTVLGLVEDDDELEPCLAAARSSSRGGPVLVEEYVSGPEVTVTGFSGGGDYVPLLVTDRICAEPPAFGVPLAESWPSPHAQAAAEVARRAVAAVGIDRGPSHVRLRLSRGGPEVIQVSARLGANHEAELVELVTGVDLYRLALGAALDWPFEAGSLASERPPPVGGATIRFLVAPSGRLESVEAPQGLKGVVTTWIYRQPGYAFAPLSRPSDRAGAILTVGTSREQAVARADAAVERIRFRTADAEALV